MPKIEEWVERSNGKIRGDVVFDKLVALGFERLGPHRPPGARGGEDELACRPPARVSAVGRRAGDVGAVGLGSRPEDRRPADVPVLRVAGVVAGSGWCSPVWDKTLPTVIACLDRSMRAFGGVPTYWLTDNEKTVSTGSCRRDRGPASVDRSGRPPLRGHGRRRACRRTRNRRVVSNARCRSRRRIWSRPTPTCATTTRSWAELVDACDEFMVKVNGREHRITRRAPVEMLAEEQHRLHRLPDAAFTAAFGETRKRVVDGDDLASVVSPTRSRTR